MSQDVKAPSPETWFYHLEGETVDDVLPALLEKTLARGWRALVRCADEAQLSRLDDILWTYRDESFLPHARAGTAEAARQPVLLTVDSADEINAEAHFLIGGAQAVEGHIVERVIILFEDADEDAKHAARKRWAGLRKTNTAISYWRRGPAGRWEKQ